MYDLSFKFNIQLLLKLFPFHICLTNIVFDEVKISRVKFRIFICTNNMPATKFKSCTMHNH